MNWDSSFETGDARVDQEHRILIGMINKFHEAVQKQKAKCILDEVLKRLEDYMLLHFSHEEQLMFESAYPDYKAHEKAHRNLTQHANEMIQGYRSGALGVPVTLSRFLQDWLSLHIMQTDMKMIRFVQEKKRAA